MTQGCGAGFCLLRCDALPWCRYSLVYDACLRLLLRFVSTQTVLWRRTGGRAVAVRGILISNALGSRRWAFTLDAARESCAKREGACGEAGDL